MANENVSPSVIARLIREIQNYQKTPVDGITLIFNEENVTDIRADIAGPEGTCYANGVFRMRLVFGSDYPQGPPKGFFMTQIFHPNVSKSGEICVNTLKRDWKPENTIQHVLQVIRCLLIEPNPESALNEEAGRMLLEGFEVFAQRARLMTSIHGIKPSTTASSSASSSATAAATATGEEGSNASNTSDSPNKKLKEKAVADKKTMDKKRSLKRL